MAGKKKTKYMAGGKRTKTAMAGGKKTKTAMAGGKRTKTAMAGGKKTKYMATGKMTGGVEHYKDYVKRMFGGGMTSAPAMKKKKTEL